MKNFGREIGEAPAMRIASSKKMKECRSSNPNELWQPSKNGRKKMMQAKAVSSTALRDTSTGRTGKDAVVQVYVQIKKSPVLRRNAACKRIWIKNTVFAAARDSI